MDSLEPTPDLTGTCWRDDMFLQFYGLHPGNVLDYFSLSVFYDRKCNNEVAKLKGLPLNQLPYVQIQLEYRETAGVHDSTALRLWPDCLPNGWHAAFPRCSAVGTCLKAGRPRTIC